MSSWAFVSGHYNAFASTNPLSYSESGDDLIPQWSAGSLGPVFIGTTIRGFFWRFRMHKEPIVVDDAGLCPANAINMGREIELLLDYAEYEKIREVLEAHAPEIDNTGEIEIPMIDYVGEKQTTLARVLDLVPARTYTPRRSGYTFAHAVCDTGFEVPLRSGLASGSALFTMYPMQGNQKAGGFRFGPGQTTKMGKRVPA